MGIVVIIVVSGLINKPIRTVIIVIAVIRQGEGRKKKEMIHLTTHSKHFIYDFMGVFLRYCI